MSESKELPHGLISAKEHASGLKPYSNMGIAAGLVIEAANLIEQQHQRINKLELMLSHIEQGEQATIAHQRVKINDLCGALDNVLNHTSTDTIAEAVAVLERVRGTQ